MASKFDKKYSTSAPSGSNLGPALKAAADQLALRKPSHSRSVSDKPASKSLVRHASLDNNHTECSEDSQVIRPMANKAGRSRSQNPASLKSGDPYNLRRFSAEQSRLFPKALAEINAGEKRSCWMWYVIPTPPFIVNGVERGSPTNKHYSIRSPEEGVAFLHFTADNVNLRENYFTIISAVEAQLKKGVNPVKLMGSLDAPKLRSSAAYFAEVADGKDEEVSKVCKSVVRLLDR